MGEKSLNRQRGTAVSQKQRSSHEKNDLAMLLHPKPSTRLSPSLVAANGGATSHCGEERGNYGETEPSSSHSPLEDIPQEALVRGSVHVRRGFVRAVVRHFSARSALSKRKRKKKKIKASNSNRTGPRPPPPPGVKTEWLQSHSLHRQTSTTPTTTFTAWLNFTHRRRGQSFTTSHERNDVIFSSNFEQINAVCKKKKKTKRHNTYSY